MQHACSCTYRLRFFRLPIDGGIVPVNLLLYRTLYHCKQHMHSRVNTSWLMLHSGASTMVAMVAMVAYKSVRSVKLSISDGIVPVNWLLFNELA
jgi:hypothetical protein